MHSGLLCVAFCLSVTISKLRLDRRSLDQNSYLAKCKSFRQTWLVASLRLIARCAHFNVKLLHFSVWVTLVWSNQTLSRMFCSYLLYNATLHQTENHIRLTVWIKKKCTKYWKVPYERSSGTRYPKQKCCKLSWNMNSPFHDTASFLLSRKNAISSA